ncbi:XdhC family protein [Thioclava sp. JE_KL1]|uniref:XdhC family protein n=1 Tax=Thioclava sp. JE_KL1 TaxID=2651187 RepID=UPI00128BAA56|nr:XdhC family protein [Thioclava sp. JE_KL1]MPQ92527.1 XdhC family protein [Thioclava sp. JE_KL1]
MDGSPLRQRARVETRLGMAEMPLPAPGRLAALAILTRIEGAGYRPLGAAMSLDDRGDIRGHLSAGCIDADIEHHLNKVAQDGCTRHLRYGEGSPFIDLVLPCGGALDITVIPAPPVADQERMAEAIDARMPLSLHLSGTQGTLTLEPQPETDLSLHLVPEPRFVIFGTGVEAETFAQLAAGAGYQADLIMPDPVSLPGVTSHEFRRSNPLGDITPDPRMAALLFFHDHDREIPILAQLLESDAFFIGAQGSRRTARQRAVALRRKGLSEAAISRLRGPVGLIEQAREPRLLAVSVLAEVLQLAQV